MYKLKTLILQMQSVATVNYYKEIFEEGPYKMLACISTGVLSMLSTFFAPIWTVLLVVGALIVVDAILGSMVSIRNKKRCFERRKLWSTIKKFVYTVMVISFSHSIDAEILKSVDAHLVELFAGLISGVELWSIIENLQTLDPTGPWKIFSKVIKSKGEKYLDITIDKEDLPKVKKLCKKIK